VVNGDGLPIAHRVFAGDVKDVGTVPQIIRDLQQQFSIARCIFVGDSGMVSEDILQQLRDSGYEYIMALKARVDRKAHQVLSLLPPAEQWQEIKPDSLYAQELPHPLSWATEPRWARDRFVACRYVETARQDTEDRQRRLQESEEYLRSFLKPESKRFRDDPDRIHQQIDRFLKRKRTQRYFEYEYAGPGKFHCQRLESKIAWEVLLDGVFLLQSNSQLPLSDLVRGYLTLAQVEAAFREVKDFLRVRPIRHWNEEAVRGHVSVCVLAYLLERVLEQTLHRAGLESSARAALGALEAVDAVTYDLQGQNLRKITKLTADQKRIFKALGEERIPAVC
jgi:transposase